jgi:hypothetical protein
MADVVQTRAALVAEYADNTSGNISAQYGRNLITTTVPYVGAVAPTVNNDAVDTAGLGTRFDAGSVWFDTTHRVVWECMSGATGAAVWVQVYPQVTTSSQLINGLAVPTNYRHTALAQPIMFSPSNGVSQVGGIFQATNASAPVVDGNGIWAPCVLNSGSAGVTAINAAHCVLEGEPTLNFVVEYPVASDFGAGQRTWIGVSDVNALATMMALSNLNSHNGIMFGLNGIAGDVNWQVCRNNGGASAPAAIDSGVAVAAATRYTLTIDATGGATSVVCLINGSAVATLTTSLPAGTTGMYLFCAIINPGNTAHTLRVGLVRIDEFPI